MTQRCSYLKASPGALFLIACLVATQAGAQAEGGDLPTAKEIWRHLYAQPGRTPEPAPLPAPASRPTPPAAATRAEPQ